MLTNPNLEATGLAAGLTGYYRLEDADLDPSRSRTATCGCASPSTGDETNHLYGEVVCVTDGTIARG